MNSHDLINLYPFAEITTKPKNTVDFFNAPWEQEWISIPLTKLSETEINLLEHLFAKNTTIDHDLQSHPWYQFLFKHKERPIDTGHFRIIQFQVYGSDADFSKTEWLKTFTNMFQSSHDSFFFNESQGILIEEKSKQTYSLEELEGLFQTLDNDFLCKTKAFLGNFMHISVDFPLLFLEEQQIFIDEVPFIKGTSVFSLPQVALQYFTKEALNQSLIMQSFRKNLAVDHEIKEIILALWNNQGNISSTAKTLFMHRNTLQYRLEKFFEQTGFSLKNMDDLSLCYLLVK